MNNSPPWVIKVDAALARVQASYREVETAFRRVRDGYREISGTIKDAMEENPALTQAEVAKHIGKSPTWVNRLIKWHDAGCKSESPFGDEIAARRAIAKLENMIATSQSEVNVNEGDMGQLWLFGGSSNYVPGRAVATLTAISFLGACQILTKAAAGLKRESLMRVRPSDDDKQLFTLEKLATELEKSIAAGTLALDEVRAALKMHNNKAA